MNIKLVYITLGILIWMSACSLDKTGVKKDAEPNNTFISHKDTFTYFTILDTNYSRYKLPERIRKPQAWKKAEQERKEDKFGLYSSSYPDTFDIKDVLKIIDTTRDLSLLRSAQSWCMNNYQQVFPYLVARLSDKRKVGLKNPADLIIPLRMGIDLQFYGHGFVMQEDIFTIAGRVSWILNELTGESFAVVDPTLTKQDTDQFKASWLKYINTLN